jgi:hypothetical protein
MRGSTRYAISVLATGVVVLVFFAIPLFLGRFCCDAGYVAAMPWDALLTYVRPSGLLPASLEAEPNVPRSPGQAPDPNERGPSSPSYAQAQLGSECILSTLGIIDYIASYNPGGFRSDVLFASDNVWVYRDRPTGQIVFWDHRRAVVDGRKVVDRRYYAGPKGIAEAAGQDLGRFVQPVVMHRRWYSRGNTMDLTVVYDRGPHQFFALDWPNRVVRNGPALDASYHVVRFDFAKTDNGMNVDWSPPTYTLRHKGETDPRRQYQVIPLVQPTYSARYLPVIDDSRSVDLLDSQTLELLNDRGFLPAPETLFGRSVPQPRELLDYRIHPVSIRSGEGPENGDKYIGMVVADESRQGTSVAMAVFDESGKPASNVIRSRGLPYEAAIGYANREWFVGSAKAAVSETRWGPLLTVAKYAVESLHPPVLTLASFFAVDQVEARAGFRALFLMPNSFVAMQRDRVGEHITAQLSWALLFMLPAVVLSLLLTWRVNQDAYAVGLSQNARALWAVGTLLFGLPAYITYRLTRPAKGLVTCPNCGHARRSDSEKCHRCGSPWLVPELTPPAWRVIGEPEDQPCDGMPAQPEETSPATKPEV